jgi:hypothetical protein
VRVSNSIHLACSLSLTTITVNSITTLKAAKFLPLNCTITRVTGRIFDAKFQKQGHQIATIVDLDSSIFNPSYKFRHVSPPSTMDSAAAVADHEVFYL